MMEHVDEKQFFTVETYF